MTATMYEIEITLDESQFDPCFVMVPAGEGGWASACFQDEFTEDWQWKITFDHIMPQSRYPELADEPWNWHGAHYGCQKRQGGYIIGPITGPANAKKGIGLAGMSPEAKSALSRRNGLIQGRSNVENGTGIYAMSPEEKFAARSKGARSRWSRTTPEERSAWSRKTLHARHHVNKGVINPNCVRCQEDAS